MNTLPLVKRKSPRIISRPKSKKEAESPEVSFNTEIDDELNSEVVVRGGVVIRRENVKEYKAPEPFNAAKYPSIQIAPSTTMVKQRHAKQLPGIADEVESYPCKFCEARVFLTSFGLEKHAKEEHPNQLESILKDIHEISLEWQRRKIDREIQVQRMMVAHKQVEYATQLARTKAPYMAPIVMNAEPSSSAMMEDAEICEICGIVINTRTGLMDQHLKAHAKNDELREMILRDHGPEEVERLTCHDCKLVFTDITKLKIHLSATHTKKRKFVCKYCGFVCNAMSELNMHKADVHGVINSKNGEVLEFGYESGPMEEEEMIDSGYATQTIAVSQKSVFDRNPKQYSLVSRTDNSPCKELLQHRQSHQLGVETEMTTVIPTDTIEVNAVDDQEVFQSEAIINLPQDEFVTEEDLVLREPDIHMSDEDQF